MVLAFWNGFTGPGTKYIEELVAGFNSSHEGRIRVEMSIMLWSDLYIKTPLALKSTMPPDCGAMHVPETAAFARSGMLIPIGPYLEDFDSSDIFANAWEPGEIDGLRYGIPMAVNPLVLFWNKGLFRDAGLDPERPPETRAEFVEFARRLTRDTDGDGRTDTWGTMIPLGWPTHFTYYSLLYSNGGALVSDDGKTCLCADAPGLDAAQFLYDLIHTYKVSPPNVEISADAEGFAVGKSAMEVNGLWMLPQFEESKRLEIGCVVMPNLGTSNRVIWSSSENLVVFSHRYSSPERTRACVDFFKYLSAHSLKWAQVGTLPARRSLYNTPEMAAMPLIMSAYRDVGFTRILDRSTQVQECVTPVIEGLIKALAGKGDPRTEIQRGAEKATLLLRQDPD